MHKEWLWKLWPFFLLALPCSYLAYTYVRLPLDGIIRTALHVNLYSLPIPLPYILLTGLYAPLTEELIKLFPLVIPSLNRMVDRTTCAAVAMIIGLGFGIGEMWLVAYWLSHDPSVVAYHWYQLGGFIFERCISCFCHGIFTAVALFGIKRKCFQFILYAMGLHALSNFPVILHSAGLLRISSDLFNNLVFGYLLAFTICLCFLLNKLRQEI